jgi:RND family efflux transporter MFP subunit
MAVVEGQILAEIDSSNVSANLALAEAQLESSRQALGETQANLDQAERMLRRTGQLASDGVVSESDLDEASSAVAALGARLVRQKADIAVAEQQVVLWKQQLDDTIIRAPFAGVVTSKNAQPGEMISPMSAGGSFTRTGICTIVDMDSLEVEVDVNETYINRVEVDQPVVSVLDSYPDWDIPSRVIAIIPTADRQKATVRVRVGFNELDPRILPDMGLKVAFKSSGDQPEPGRRIVVPARAVQRVGGRDVVWVVRDGKVERRAVTVGSKEEDSVTLAAGVSGGERVVISALAELAEGVFVKEEES